MCGQATFLAVWYCTGTILVQYTPYAYGHDWIGWCYSFGIAIGHANQWPATLLVWQKFMFLYDIEK